MTLQCCAFRVKPGRRTIHRASVIPTDFVGFSAS